MKNINLKTIALLFGVASLASCSENSWNDHLDGFEGGFNYSGTENVSYTLSNSDYESISKMLLKVSKNHEDSVAANAIKSNYYFDQSSPFPAQVAIPYFLADTSSEFYIYNDGSVTEISFRQADSTPEEIKQISSASVFTLNNGNYQTVWGSETDYVASFSPSHAPERYLPNLLKERYPDAREGDYAVVTYNNASENPIFGTIGGGDDDKEIQLTDNIKNLAKGDNLSATAVVTGQCSRGLILTDKAGSVFYYNTGVDLSAYPIGTVVKVAGELGAYNHGLQLTDAASIEVVGKENYSYPMPTAYTAAMVDEACKIEGDMLATYVSIDGKVSVSGNYYNVIIDGASAQGSVYYATDDMKAMMEDGESYTFFGYFMAVSGSDPKYFNILVTSVGELGSETPGPGMELTDNIKNLAKGDNLTATAVVTAQCARGLIFTDNAGSIFYYNTKVDLSAYPIGTIVNVSGEVGAYNTGLQLTDAATLEIVGSETYTYPAPTACTPAMIDEACTRTTDELAEYVSIQGKLSVSGNYYNVIIDGAEAQGSVYYATDELKESLADGESYTFYGYFMAVSGSSPKYFNIIVTEAVPFSSTAAYAARLSKIAAFTPSVSVENAIYYFNGSSWTVADNAVVLNPDDYEEMGFSNNGLSDANIYIPLYLKANYPYAVSGDQMFVAYNLKTDSGCSCSLFVYDGMNWTLNNNNLEDVTGQFTKNNGVWSFTKYLGKAIYDLFEESQIELNRTYMIVSGAVCANPVVATNSYGYLLTTSVEISNNQIVMPNEANGFSFETTYIVDDKTQTVEEGKFLIRDSNNRYMYLKGTFSSFNVSDAPFSDGDGFYLFYAQRNEDGTWAIKNDKSGDDTRTMFYSSGYDNFAAYASQGANDSYPVLYILEEE